VTARRRSRFRLNRTPIKPKEAIVKNHLPAKAILALAALSLGLTNVAAAEGPAPVAPATAPSADDALVQRLEQSGALDKAVERAVGRYIERQKQARQKAQEEAEAKAEELARKARPVNAGRDHLWGDAKAPISIIEYSDFECPFCKRFHGIPEAVVKRMDGKVNFVWRQLPLDMHGPKAKREAEAAECAGRIGGNDAYWRYSNGIMERTRSNGQGLPEGDRDPLLALADELKIDAAAFGKCLDSNEVKQRLADDAKDAADAGITGTPGIILRNAATGKTLAFAGAVSTEELEARVQELLSGK
jgi:protein-disulfide isomerase